MLVWDYISEIIFTFGQDVNRINVLDEYLVNFIEHVLNFDEVFLHWAFFIRLLAIYNQKCLLSQVDHDLERLRKCNYTVRSLAALFEEQLCERLSWLFS